MRSFSPRGRSVELDLARPAAERYQILGRIAAGGMAEIYLARVTSRSGERHEVALKRLYPELQTNQEFVQMFFDEARIASQLGHPNIVDIYELGELDGSLFIAMELVRGVNLKQIFERATELGRPLPMPFIQRIAIGALDALAHAHTFRGEDGAPLNIVHRDVSPQNIAVTWQGDVKLLDFGVARAENRLHQTRQGLVKGKFAYMAPEQIVGEPVDGRADLFALAEVLYLLAAHRHPFFAETDAGVLHNVLQARPPSPSSLDPKIPAALSALLLRALERRPDDRFADARAMRDAVELTAIERGRTVGDALGRWLRELFADRLGLEDDARRRGDDDLLVDAMRAGSRARPVFRPKAPRPAITPATATPSEARAAAKAKARPTPARSLVDTAPIPVAPAKAVVAKP
ncbi:serine/threonine protein kinase, partial [Myxococcota bacterium]|nr:serine/threonine protein kinase [Myxococcota bacterium]